MSYSGTTAATSVSNPPVLLSRIAGARTILGTKATSAWSSASPTNLGLGVWLYSSTNLSTDLTGAGFFSDGQSLGMQVGDLMLNVQFTSAGSSFVSGIGVLLTTNSSGGWNLSTGGFNTSTA